MVKDEKVQTKSLAKASTEEKFDMIVEINDSMLDRVGNLLDEAEGLKKRHEEFVVATLNEPANRKAKANFAKWNEKSNQVEAEIANVNQAVIRKPQLDFEDKIDNFSLFVPTIKFKHNSIKPLSIAREYNDRGEYHHPNPYEVEITSYKLLAKFLKQTKPRKPASFEKTEFKYIDTEADLSELLEYLKSGVEEFAVDLEYHAQRSFLGFTCLMQISTREKDFVIDTIKLRNKMHILNEVFTDPKVLKVFHGADLDIRWLQKDFDIYVVNMFDTGKAAKLLQFASFSLSFLFKHYCNENLIKKYQLADWRIRPLPKGMLNYARSDTHSLLYIFDRLRNDLIKRDGVELLKQAFEESRKVSLVRFEVPTISENSYLALIMRNRVKFNNRQRQAFKEIYSWRDHLARLEDECTNYILPNHMMLKIAEVLPQEQQGILACCNPIPAAVKKHLNELHLIILKARELPLDQSNENDYLLKPIVNQLIDITLGMDILDEEHADEHHQVRHDCLLDSAEMLHEIKLSRTKRPEASGLISFFTPAEPNEVGRSVMPFEAYRKVMETKRKEAIKEEAEKETKIDINQVPEIRAKDITNEPNTIVEETTIDREEEMTKRLETTPIIEINKKKKKAMPDIPLEVSDSINNLISSAMTGEEKAGDAKADEAGTSDQAFNYNQADYSIFSKNSQPANKYFDPSEKFMKQKQVGGDWRMCASCSSANRKSLFFFPEKQIRQFEDEAKARFLHFVCAGKQEVKAIVWCKFSASLTQSPYARL